MRGASEGLLGPVEVSGYSSPLAQTRPMSDRERRGMLITNNGTDSVEISMSSRRLSLDPGEEALITPEEVRDPTLRTALQERSIAIVRPATPTEEEALRERLDDQ
ncbi:MAG: hypothetical protein ABEK84_02085 [Salinibacter sp.]